ncbi:VOC family protein [Massilia niastensis]|uniref:VOC family protein n=1 Tax=Massilia niastensis TaxID=544911 RepID=UPI0003804F8A|nr:VOC family protein [Massilia niastensis]
MSSTVIPCLRYRDAPAAIDWLCRCLGFEQRLVVPGKSCAVAHAELVLGGGMVMLGSHADDRFAQLIVPPERIGGVQTQTTWVQVNDADEIYARVVESGARIVQEIDDAPFGGRVFACRDPEGHVWHVGTYDPWKG